MEPTSPRRRRHYKKRPAGFSRGLVAGLSCAVCVVVAAAGFSNLGSPVSATEDPSPSPVPQLWVEVPQEEASSPASVAPSPSPQQTDSWELVLVNRDHPLPQDFTVELQDVAGGQFDVRAAGALEQMLSDMESQGLSPVVCSSFRTWEDQERLHQDKVDRLLEEGCSQENVEEEASRWVVPAGQSEHELGLAVDIVSASYQLLEQPQENTPEQQWLMAHCAEYGFILRYPPEKQEITQVGYEPWHYRYVGVDAAREITQQGLCLEEYLGQAG